MRFWPGWLSFRTESVARRYWWVIGVIWLFILALELLEPDPLNPVHLGEFILYSILLVIIGSLIQKLKNALEEKDRAYTILEFKHKLSMDLALAKDMQDLCASIIDFLNFIARPVYSSFIIYEAERDTDQPVYEWKSDPRMRINLHFVKSLAAGQPSLQSVPNSSRAMQVCTIEPSTPKYDGLNEYRLPLFYGGSLIALLDFMLPLDKLLGDEQTGILENIGSEIATAVKSVQHRQALANRSVAEAAQAERREISRDLHDILGQNLSYLRLKLDQFSLTDYPGQISEIRCEMEKMRDAANEAYELVRGGLELLQSSPSNSLADLLRKQARSVADRADIVIDFIEDGQPRPLLPRASRQILFAFIETLSNITRHSGAQTAEIRLLWQAADLTLSIRDDGHGFNPDAEMNHQHYGLKIIQERIKALGGQFSLQSTPEKGTAITFLLPLETILEPLPDHPTAIAGLDDLSRQNEHIVG